MNQIQIGRFIAEERKARGMTQAQLAEALHISDKTISKWERGRGLPEVSLLLPLCEILGIRVNDLLCGKRISPCDYQKNAEQRLLGLLQENQESRKKMALSFVLGSLAILSVVALVLLASFLDIPVPVRILLILLAACAAIAGVTGAAVLDRESGVFICPFCHAAFVPSMEDYIQAYHTFTKRRLTCPECGRTGLCKHRVSP